MDLGIKKYILMYNSFKHFMEGNGNFCCTEFNWPHELLENF